MAAALVAIVLLSSAPLSGVADFDWSSLFATKAAAEGSTEGYYTYSVSDGNAIITMFDSSVYGDIEIPSTLGGYPVTSIGDSAFYECDGLKSVTIPDSVTDIGTHAFYYSGLTSLTMGNNVKNIGSYAFYTCDGLKNVTIPDSVAYIGEYAFADCYNMTSVTLGKGIKNIGGYAFDGCINLKTVNYTGTIGDWCRISFYSLYSNPVYLSQCLYINGEPIGDVIIPNDITEFDYNAFTNCKNLTGITIPGSITEINSLMFEGCTGLTSIKVDESNTVYDSRDNCNAVIESKTNTLVCGCKNSIIPDSVTSIGDYAFYYRDGLTRIIIPKSVTSIGYDAFYGCDSLADVYYYGEEADWNNITIDSGNDCLTNANIHYAKATVKLTLNKTTLQLEPNNATKLIATITPEVSTDIVWSSSDTTVAAVENGVVWAVSEGVAVITATLAEGSKSASCTVIVREKPEDFKLDTQDASISVNDTIQLNGIFTPDDISNKNISRKSYDESVATVDENGLVTGHKAGATVIIATAENGGLKDFCLIKVVGITASSKLTTIDSENGLIYGITPGSTTLNDFVTLGASDYTLEYDNKFEKVGTGSVVNLICDDSVADSYTVVIFGDTDGDGWYNGQDAVMVSMLASGMLTREQVGEAVYMAADCNHNGVIDQADVDLLNQAGALLSNVDQTLSTEEMLETAAYKEYSELIDQTPTIDEAEDDTAEETPTEGTPTANNLWTILMAYLEKILSFIISLFKIA